MNNRFTVPLHGGGRQADYDLKGAQMLIEEKRLERKFKQKNCEKVVEQLKDLTSEIRAMTDRINSMNKTITEIRENLRGYIS